MSVADNSIIRAAAHFSSVNTSDVVNIFHYVIDSVGPQSEEDVLTDLLAIVEGLMANVVGFYSSSTQLDQVIAWVWNSALERWDTIGSINGTWTGSQGSTDNMPAQNAPQVNADTVDTHAHGRKYLPPMLETATADALLTVPCRTALGDYLSDWTGTAIGTVGEYASGVWQEATKTFKQFTGTGAVIGRVGTQRRRKLNVGS